MSRHAAKLTGFGLKPSSQSRHLSASSLPPLNLALSSRALQDNESSSDSMEEKFERWMVKFGRVYKDAAEKQRRFNIFKFNARYTRNHNGDGANLFADLTNEEYAMKYSRQNMPQLLLARARKQGYLGYRGGGAEGVVKPVNLGHHGVGAEGVVKPVKD